MNPYKPPQAQCREIGIRVHKPSRLLRWSLIVTGLLLALPPLPLFLWVAEEEPFFGPSRMADLFWVVFSGAIGFCWVVWTIIVSIGVWNKWLSRRWLSVIPASIIAGSVSFLVVYLYGVDRSWF